MDYEKAQRAMMLHLNQIRTWFEATIASLRQPQSTPVPTMAHPAMPFGMPQWSTPPVYNQHPAMNGSVEPVLKGYDYLQRGMLWLLAAIGWMIVMEPAPYEFLFLLLFVLYLPNGMTVTRKMAPLIVFLLLYNVGGAFSVVQISDNPKSVTFVAISFYMAVMAMFFAFVTAKAPEKITPVVQNGYIIGGVAASICGVMGYFDIAGTRELWAPESRAQAFYKDGNVFGAYLVFPATLLGMSLLTGTQKHKLPALAGLLIVLTAIFLAFSRGAWAAVTISMLLSIGITFLITDSVRLRSRIVLYAIVGAFGVGVLISFALSIEEVRALFLDRAQLIKHYDVGETGRFGRQMASIPVLMQSPNGLGPFGFGRLFGQDPHNVYLNAFASYGWLGGFSYLLLIIATVIAGLRTIFVPAPWQNFAIVLFASLFASILQGAQIDTDHWRHFYLQLGMIWGLYAATELHRDKYAALKNAERLLKLQKNIMQFKALHDNPHQRRF